MNPGGRSISVFGPANEPKAELSFMENQPALKLYGPKGSVLEKLPK
jgi:hypothetical protein